MIHWQLTSQQYEAAVFAAGRDRLPYPTWHAARADSDAELGRQRREAIDALVPRVDDDFARLVATLLDPRVRVHVHGRIGADDPAQTQLRGYAAFGPTAAAVAIQDPDPAPGVSGDVVVSACTARQAITLLARLLPDEPPGQREQLVAPVADLDVEPDWVGGWNRPPTLRERVSTFFARPRAGWGEVLCYPGPFLDNRTDGVQGFLWMDFAGDGRYYVRQDDAGYTAIPMSGTAFGGHVARLVQRVRDQARTPA
ncbi:hypothetical protein [Nocardia wallacei]|uniref:hypothetical protein n=1 Tax=Nocardia wallacei TaxID=480035 RepID=UPI002456917F|nr:hypothetical protein [Nocardia wallacei]